MPRTPLSTATASLPATPPKTVAALGALLEQGLAATASTHLRFTTGLAGSSLTGDGVAQLASGKVTGLDVHETVSGVGQVLLLFAGGSGYVALPKPTAVGKPYTLIGGSAGGSELSTSAIALEATQLLAAPATYRTLVAASDGLTLVGTETVDGRPALHYRATAHVDRVPATDPVRIALGALNVTGLALQLWVDGAGRPLKVAAPSPDGRVSDVAFTEINQPVQVSAPPPGQVDGKH